jgi:hypothetical protein
MSARAQGQVEEIELVNPLAHDRNDLKGEVGVEGGGPENYRDPGIAEAHVPESIADVERGRLPRGPVFLEGTHGRIGTLGEKVSAIGTVEQGDVSPGVADFIPEVGGFQHGYPAVGEGREGADDQKNQRQRAADGRGKRVKADQFKFLFIQGAHVTLVRSAVRVPLAGTAIRSPAGAPAIFTMLSGRYFPTLNAKARQLKETGTGIAGGQFKGTKKPRSTVLRGWCLYKIYAAVLAIN